MPFTVFIEKNLPIRDLFSSNPCCKRVKCMYIQIMSQKSCFQNKQVFLLSCPLHENVTVIGSSPYRENEAMNLKEEPFVHEQPQAAPSDPWVAHLCPTRPPSHVQPLRRLGPSSHPAQPPWEGPGGKHQAADTHTSPQRAGLLHQHHFLSELILRIECSCVPSPRSFLSKLLRAL